MATKSMAEEITLVQRDNSNVKRFQDASNEFDALVKRGLTTRRVSPEIGMCIVKRCIAFARTSKEALKYARIPRNSPCKQRKWY